MTKFRSIVQRCMAAQLTVCSLNVAGESMHALCIRIAQLHNAFCMIATVISSMSTQCDMCARRLRPSQARG